MENLTKDSVTLSKLLCHCPFPLLAYMAMYLHYVHALLFGVLFFYFCVFVLYSVVKVWALLTRWLLP